MAKKSEIIGEFIVTIRDNESVEVSRIYKSTIASLKEIWTKNDKEIPDKEWNTQEWGRQVLKEFCGGAKEGVIGEYSVEREENNRINVIRTYKNTMEGLREVAKELNFLPDPKQQGWNTQRYGAVLVKYAQTGEMPKLKEEKISDLNQVVKEGTTESVDVPNRFKGIPLVDLSFTKLEMTDEEIEENSDELDVPGVIIIYAYDEDGDFEATAWSDGSIYDNLVDGCREWTNQYEGERRLEYYISKQFDKYGFSDDVEEDDINLNIGSAISTYVGDYGSRYSLGSPLLIRAKWENKTDIFTINKDGSFGDMWSLEKEFPELIRLTLAGENVKEFPAIPIYKGIFVDINVDDVLTASSNELIDRIKEDVSWAKYAGTIFFKCTYKDDTEFEICIKEKNAEVAFQQLKDAVKSNGSEIDWCDYAHILIESEGFNSDGTSINPDKTIDMVCQLKMREERFDTLPEWTGSACFFYSVQQRSNRSNYPDLLQYNANGEEVDLDVEMEEIEEKFDLNSEE